MRNIALLPLHRSLQRFQDRIGVSLVSPKLLSSPRFETKIVCIDSRLRLATQQQRGLSEGTVGRNRLSTNAAPVSASRCSSAWESALTIGKSLASLLVRHGLHPNIDGHALRLLRRQNPCFVF